MEMYVYEEGEAEASLRSTERSRNVKSQMSVTVVVVGSFYIMVGETGGDLSDLGISSPQAHHNQPLQLKTRRQD